MKDQQLTHQIIASAYTVHNVLGSGYLEKVYENALFIELQTRGIKVQQRLGIPVFYKGVQIDDYVGDLLVEDKIIIELKAVENLHPIHEAQLVNYLTATGLDFGLLINFGKSVEVKRKYRIYKPKNETGFQD